MTTSPLDQALVFVVDDDPSLRTLLSFWLEKQGCQVHAFADGPACMEAMKRMTPEVVCLDFIMEPWDGPAVMAHIHAVDPGIPVIFITSKNEVDTAVSLMRTGAFDYQVKPLDPDRFLVSVRNALAQRGLLARVSDLTSQLNEKYSLEAMIGRSPQMQELFAQVAKVARSDVAVMVLGESGTGKELVARAIHSLSGRAQGPFVDLNCAAIPETLIDSELFGHEKGAFTGAVTTHKGRFERADTGVLFLDEVAELGLSTQVRLLRVLQEQRFERVGGTRSLQVDVRIVSATHRDLDDMVEKGDFRQDLFYRLNVFPLTVPPLRQRPDDIPLLVAHFLAKHGPRNQEVTLEAETLELLKEQPWPGNVRELENVIQFALVVRDDPRILPRHLPPRYRQGAPTATPGASPATAAATMSDIERQAIIQAIHHSQGNLSEAAKTLGLGRTTLYRKMAAYGLKKE